MLLTVSVACVSNIDKGDDNMKKQNSFKYVGSHYVISETGAQASVVADDVSEDIYGGAFMEDPLLESDFSAEVTVRPKSKVSDVSLNMSPYCNGSTHFFNADLIFPDEEKQLSHRFFNNLSLSDR